MSQFKKQTQMKEWGH